MDFHTHNLAAAPGTAIVNLPREALSDPASFHLIQGGCYSVGIHPWWVDEDWQDLWQGLQYWVGNPQIVALGECGLDKLRGPELVLQEKVFLEQVALSERMRLPVTVHCVRAFGRLMELHRSLRPSVRWTVHGFRGKPELARQLLAEGMNLSFGRRYRRESWELTPPARRFVETDDDWKIGLPEICP